ncbi:MAG TPA: hypothetical protein VF698_04550, partial [Thermoanaerobaculia bacterium]
MAAAMLLVLFARGAKGECRLPSREFGCLLGDVAVSEPVLRPMASFRGFVSAPDVASDGERFVVAWERAAELLDADGRPLAATPRTVQIHRVRNQLQ